MAKRIPVVVYFPTPSLSEKRLYFDNNKVEDLMRLYRLTGCTDVKLRGQIMANTEELIRQIIRAHNLHRIYPGQEESAFMDLFQTAWAQLERVLYKYKARVHCADCYNPIRPSDSCIYDPPQLEYEIIAPEDVLKFKLRCPNCKKIPRTITYRGTSKIFNLWCVNPNTIVNTQVGERHIGDVRIGDYVYGAGRLNLVVSTIRKSARPTKIVEVDGHMVEAAPQHYLMGYDGWVQVENLKIGDIVAIEEDCLNKDKNRTLWLPITKIVDSKSEVCDIEVDSEEHAYVANGFISHNSQISRTVILACIKKESRDYKNADVYRAHLDNKHAPKGSDAFYRFVAEARSICKHNVAHLAIIDALEHIAKTEDRPADGLICKLVEMSGQSRAQVIAFLKIVRLRCDEFTDSPMNDKHQRLRSVAAEDEL